MRALLRNEDVIMGGFSSSAPFPKTHIALIIGLDSYVQISGVSFRRILFIKSRNRSESYGL